MNPGELMHRLHRCLSDYGEFKEGSTPCDITTFELRDIENELLIYMYAAICYWGDR